MSKKPCEKAQFEISHKVPVPTAMRQKPVERKYPFDKLDVGEMFFIPNRKKNNISTHTSTVGKLLKRKFVTRLTYMVHKNHGWALCDPDTDGAVQGIGVWRVS